MRGMYDHERRGPGPISPDPSGTGRKFAAAKRISNSFSDPSCMRVQGAGHGVGARRSALAQQNASTDDPIAVSQRSRRPRERRFSRWRSRLRARNSCLPPKRCLGAMKRSRRGRCCGTRNRSRPNLPRSRPWRWSSIPNSRSATAAISPPSCRAPRAAMAGLGAGTWRRRTWMPAARARPLATWIATDRPPRNARVRVRSARTAASGMVIPGQGRPPRCTMTPALGPAAPGLKWIGVASCATAAVPMPAASAKTTRNLPDMAPVLPPPV